MFLSVIPTVKETMPLIDITAFIPSFDMLRLKHRTLEMFTPLGGSEIVSASYLQHMVERLSNRWHW